MSLIYNFLFPLKPNDRATSLLLLAFRLLFGILLMSHGIQKLMNFDTLATTFPDPLGVGSQLSLILAIFGELVCSIGFVFGLLYRLALIPMIFTMYTIVFIVLAHAPFSGKELPVIYLVAFVIMYMAGAGKYSLDHFIAKALRHKKAA